jgi:hypothetical protein
MATPDQQKRIDECVASGVSLTKCQELVLGTPTLDEVVVTGSKAPTRSGFEQADNFFSSGPSLNSSNTTFDGQFVGPVVAKRAKDLASQGVVDPLNYLFLTGELERIYESLGGKNNKKAAETTRQRRLSGLTLAGLPALAVLPEVVVTAPKPKLTPIPGLVNLGGAGKAANDAAFNVVKRGLGAAIGVLDPLLLLLFPLASGGPGTGNLLPEHEKFKVPNAGSKPRSDPRPGQTTTATGPDRVIGIDTRPVLDEFVVTPPKVSTPQNRPASDLLPFAFGNPVFNPFPGFTATPIPSVPPRTNPGSQPTPLPRPGANVRPGVRPAPRLPAPRLPAPVPLVPDVFDPLQPVQTAPKPAPAPFTPANPFVDSPFNLAPSPQPQPVPQPELDRCNCDKPKKEKKERKDRTSCKRYTVRQLSRGQLVSNVSVVDCSTGARISSVKKTRVPKNLGDLAKVIFN